MFNIPFSDLFSILDQKMCVDISVYKNRKMFKQIKSNQFINLLLLSNAK